MSEKEEICEMKCNSDLILSIRLIRSFEYRNIRHLTVKNLASPESLTGSQLKEEIRRVLLQSNLPAPFKNFAFDTLKIEHFPHHAKTNDVVLNRENDERLIIEDEKLLSDYKIVTGTEIGFFKRTDYEIYKENPTFKME